jgi:ubiquitin carboxyl-terminal hydrolase 10
MVYCLPFNRLFSELGRLLAGANGGKEWVPGGTPLVDATIGFLKEFAVEDGKGKDMINRGRLDDDEESKGKDAFIPTYVYDALKEKKRFDNMRVRSPASIVSYVLIAM